jgi:hypothetical protein
MGREARNRRDALCRASVDSTVRIQFGRGLPIKSKLIAKYSLLDLPHQMTPAQVLSRISSFLTRNSVCLCDYGGKVLVIF